MHQLRQVGIALDQRRQDARVERLGTPARHAALDRQSAELVPKAERILVMAQQPPRHRFVGALAAGIEQAARQPAGRATRHQRDELCQLARRGRALHEACQHRVAHRLGHRALRGRQQLAHEERVAGGDAMDVRGVVASAACELLDRRPATGREPQACRVLAGELAEHRAQRMARSARRPGGSRSAGCGYAECAGPGSRTKSSVASSAQCRSSSTTTLAGCGGDRPSSTRRNSCSRASPGSRRAVAGSAAATSLTGPSTREVCSASQCPHRMRVPRGACWVNSSTSALLPAPASPLTKAILPARVPASRRYCASCSSCGWRSRRSTPGVSGKPPRLGTGDPFWG